MDSIKNKIMENSENGNIKSGNSVDKTKFNIENASRAATNESQKTPGNASFEHESNDPNNHNGSQELAEKYNINDKAHTDSSAKDFVKTVSNFNHANNDNSENPSDDSRNHS